MSVGAASVGRLAVRPGGVYTGDGQASFGLPAGDYVKRKVPRTGVRVSARKHSRP
jgi:hypothetical protein